MFDVGCNVRAFRLQTQPVNSLSAAIGASSQRVVRISEA
jgi:hypothetical protein